ncbi:hypothetical protein GW930_00820 [Candidatus Saccharibacteria bacterium]|nr:hypothetical protein [Candidatus Saccharibacteria bacterium]
MTASTPRLRLRRKLGRFGRKFVRKAKRHGSDMLVVLFLVFAIYHTSSISV